MCMEKKERKEREILTENRLSTVNKRETSFEGLVSQLESGEDGIYNFINENKNAIFQPKISITPKDIEEIPSLRELREAIKIQEERLKRATGKNAFLLKKSLIEMRKDQYLLKTEFRQPISAKKRIVSKPAISFKEHLEFDEDGYVVAKGISLMNPQTCSAILCNYSKLKQDSWDNFESDTWYLMQDFDEISAQALKDYPLYERIVELKIDGKQNKEIQETLDKEFAVKHSVEYISSLWRKKIPSLIASAAEDQYLDWYYLTQARGAYKKCSRCGQIKLAHNKYFSKNKTSKDGFYSICKECRNKKKGV